jgi:cell division protein ZapA (FtsZ GTPase activity inhibitor)
MHKEPNKVIEDLENAEKIVDDALLYLSKKALNKFKSLDNGEVMSLLALMVSVCILDCRGKVEGITDHVHDKVLLEFFQNDLNIIMKVLSKEE